MQSKKPDLARAREQAGRKSRSGGSRVRDPYVIGAFIYPGLDLNLTDYGVTAQLLVAYEALRTTMAQANTPLPTNAAEDDGGTYLKRNLDCAVINTVHKLRQDSKDDPYQTVYGVFEEGGPLYENAGFRAKTHVQVAVIDPDLILNSRLPTPVAPYQ